MKHKEFNKYEVKDGVAYIYLYKKNVGEFITLIDEEDLERVKSLDLTWHAFWNKTTRSYYCRATKYHGLFNGKPKYETIYLHKFILNEINCIGDHINHNTLDNRKINLRPVNKEKNLMHRNGKNINNKSGYRNVSWIGNKWAVQLQVNGNNTRLGYFDDVHEAGKFAEEMREKYYGEYKGKNERKEVV